MGVPDLGRIVDTYVPVPTNDFATYLSQLRRDVLPHIRALQSGNHLRWFSFLLHDARQLAGREPMDGRLFIHIRLEPAPDVDISAFIALLPNHFCRPQQVQLSAIAGVDASSLEGDNWAQAWRIHGEASAWVLCLLEGHKGEPSLQQVVQFLHFITNPLMLGSRCQCTANGLLTF